MKRFFQFSLFITMLIIATTGCTDTGRNAGTSTGDFGIPGDRIVYTITDYYDKDGNYSTLGRALTSDPNTGDKALYVEAGNIISFGNKLYEVVVGVMTLFFYTQPSYDEVIVWWTDFLDEAANNNRVVELRL